MNGEIHAILERLSQYDLKIATAESCTTGMLASLVGDVPGCAKWLECAFVTYSEAAKISCLGVNPDTIKQYGLTSEEVAREMASGALPQVHANLAIATTGVVDDNGDGEVKPGTVCLAWAFDVFNFYPQVFSETRHFEGSRNSVRQQAAEYAIFRIEQHYHKLKNKGGGRDAA